jgi:hypothetical protein
VMCVLCFSVNCGVAAEVNAVLQHKFYSCLRHMFLLMLFVPGVNCTWFALRISQHVDVFLG